MQLSVAVDSYGMHRRRAGCACEWGDSEVFPHLFLGKTLIRKGLLEGVPGYFPSLTMKVMSHKKKTSAYTYQGYHIETYATVIQWSQHVQTSTQPYLLNHRSSYGYLASPKILGVTTLAPTSGSDTT